MVKYKLPYNGETVNVYIPEPVLVLFDDEFDYRFVSNWRELTNMAVSLFVGLTALDSAPSSGGGGSGNDNGWRDRKEEDELERARRCVRYAVTKIGKTPKSRKR